jgi:hypothetical protein
MKQRGGLWGGHFDWTIRRSAHRTRGDYDTGEQVMDAELKAKWIDAMRSGNYRQGKGYLRSGKNEHCCLGVLADVCGAEWTLTAGGDRYELLAELHMHGVQPAFGTLSEKFRDLVGLSEDDAFTLMRKNDGGESFTEIADHIERNL